jgi:hypothetical protein
MVAACWGSSALDSELIAAADAALRYARRQQEPRGSFLPAGRAQRAP